MTTLIVESTSPWNLWLSCFLSLNEGQPSTKGFYKNEILIKEFIIILSITFTKNELLLRVFEVLCPSCRTLILQNMSRWLLLQQQMKIMKLIKTIYSECSTSIHSYPLKTSEIRGFLGAWEWKIGWKWVNKNLLFSL